VPHVVYIQHENTFLSEVKPPVIEIEKWYGTAKPEGEEGEALDLFLVLKGSK